LAKDSNNGTNHDLGADNVQHESVYLSFQVTHFNAPFLRVHHDLALITCVNADGNHPFCIGEICSFQEKLIGRNGEFFIGNCNEALERMKVLIWGFTSEIASQG